MRYLLVIGLLAMPCFCYAQADVLTPNHQAKSFGISAQVYPAGFIATINLDKFSTPKTSLIFRAGCNLIERKDFSKINDHESGFGLGASAGYRKHYRLKKGEILAAFNLDLWNEWIKWENNLGQPDETTGKTYTLVVQPWLETGYFTPPNKSSLQYGLTLGFGREINVITDGKEVAQGWIGSLLIHFQYRIKGGVG